MSPEDLAINRDEESGVRAALSRLPRHSATVLVLRHSGLSCAEVADATGVKVGQVGTMLRRAEAVFGRGVRTRNSSCRLGKWLLAAEPRGGMGLSFHCFSAPGSPPLPAG